MWQFPKPRLFPALLLLVLASCSSQSDLNQALRSDSPSKSVDVEQALDRDSQRPATTAAKAQPDRANQLLTRTTAPDPVKQHPVAAKPPVKPTGDFRLAEPTPPQTPIRASEPTPPLFDSTQRMAGFSASGNYYIYLESARDTGAGIPKSTLQVVNMTSNACMAGGCLETTYGEQDASLTIAEAEQDLLQRTWTLRRELGLTPPVAGHSLAIQSRSRMANGSEVVTARLNDSGSSVQVRLTQQRNDKGGAMQLEVVYKGQRRSLDSLNNYRDWVQNYSIREIKQSPTGDQIAILITATKPTFEGNLQTTIVQGLEL